MRIQRVTIRHFTSIESLQITFGNTVMLVGQNNAGKSNLLKALDLFFDPIPSKISQESFYRRDTSSPIEIVLEFGSLSLKEEEYFSSYVHDNTLKVKRKIEWDSASSKPKVHHIGFNVEPTTPFLREAEISATSIDSWWKDRDRLSVRGLPFADKFPTKPTVSQWKEAAERFILEHREVIEFQEVERENISGYEGVLKGGLPKFIFVPAVRDILEEAKVAKTNPFGTLIYSVLTLIPSDERRQIADSLGAVSRLLNPGSGATRIQGIADLETRLNSTLAELAPGCKLQLEMSPPTIEEIFTNVTIIMDDGFRGTIDGKGHGLQRWVIFTILRAYAENSRTLENDERQRSIIFAIEEPEIYLHPQAQRTMYRALFEIGEKGDQVIYSTHSSLLVDIAYFDRLCLLSRRRTGDEYRTEVKQLSIQQMKEDLKVRYPQLSPTEQSMRERYSHVYTAARNEGFFAQKIIIVEGPSEEYALPLYCYALGYEIDREGVSVINAGGKGLIDRLLRLYNEFGIPCYVIFDGDKSTEDPENKRISRQLLDLMQYGQSAPSMSLVEERFAMFEENFEKLMSAEVQDYSSMVEAARKSLGLRSDSGAPLVSRYIASILVERGRQEHDPPKYVPPTIKGIVNMVRNLQWKGSVLRRHEDQ